MSRIVSSFGCDWWATKADLQAYHGEACFFPGMTPEMDLQGNHKMDWFFNEYVYGTALPSYKFNYSFDKEGSAERAQRRSETRPAELYDVLASPN